MKEKILYNWDQELSFGLEKLHDISTQLLNWKYPTINDDNFNIFEYIYNYQGTNEDIISAKQELQKFYQEDELFQLIKNWKKLWIDSKFVSRKNRTGEVTVWSIFDTLKQTK